MSFKSQIILLISIPLVLMSLIVGTYNYFSTSTFALANARGSMDLLARNMATEIDLRLEQIDRTGNTLAIHFSSAPFMSEDQIYSALEYVYSSNEAIYGGSLIYDEYKRSPDIRLYAPYVSKSNGSYARTAIKYDYTIPTEAKNEWFTVPKRTGKSHWSTPYLDEGAGEVLMCTFSVPFTIQREFAGVIGIDVSIEWLQRFISDVPGEMGN